MTQKSGKITDKGAVKLEEQALDDAQGGIIAVAPADRIKFDSALTKKAGDGSVSKISDPQVKFFP